MSVHDYPQQFVEALRGYGVATREHAERLPIETRDRILAAVLPVTENFAPGLALTYWGGREDDAWDEALRRLEFPHGGIWRNVGGVRPDGRCSKCLGDPAFDAGTGLWTCPSCGHVSHGSEMQVIE